MTKIREVIVTQRHNFSTRGIMSTLVLAIFELQVHSLVRCFHRVIEKSLFYPQFKDCMLFRLLTVFLPYVLLLLD